MGARARGLAAVRRRGGVRVRDLPRGLVERLRAGRPGHHPAEPASGLAIRALARLPRAILASRSRGTPLSPARRRHLCTRRAGGRRALVPLREPAVARGWERRRGRVGAAVDRRHGRAFMGGWGVMGVVCGAARGAVLHQHTGFHEVAPVFAGAGPVAVRLTAIAALADIGRLLVFPLRLRVDYSPAERTLVTSPLDGRFLLGLACLAIWGVLLGRAWRRRRRVEALGLGWIAIAYLPVANLFFPSGVLVAEHTLYAPSIGLTVALGAWLARLEPRRAALVGGLLVLAGSVRAAMRVPVWHDDLSVVLSILEDSPASYRGPQYTAMSLQARRLPEKALEDYLIAFQIFDRDSRVLIGAADAAWTLRRSALADSLMDQARARCGRCEASLGNQAAAALVRGDTAVADSLLEQVRRAHNPSDRHLQKKST